ncbi:uncharacterized protein METZ01_LOCUS29774 [marine metagenome]|uniref:Uncharacterized protein n=1 Tax=marine metagenome TaxID=408172 RepID=A0A381QD32_9ZZZZ
MLCLPRTLYLTPQVSQSHFIIVLHQPDAITCRPFSGVTGNTRIKKLQIIMVADM